MTDSNENNGPFGTASKTGSRVCLKSEAEAVFDTFENNPPPDVGFQPYTGDDAEGGEG